MQTGVFVKVTVSTILDTTIDRAWAAVTQTHTFHHVTHGLLSFRSSKPFPSVWHEEDQLELQLYLFNVIPWWRHQLRVAHLDDQRHELRLEGHGGPISRWNHTMRIEPVSDTRCQYTDELDLRAGLFTPVAWLFAHTFYRYRQRRLRKRMETSL